MNHLPVPRTQVVAGHAVLEQAYPDSDLDSSPSVAAASGDQGFATNASYMAKSARTSLTARKALQCPASCKVVSHLLHVERIDADALHVEAGLALDDILNLGQLGLQDSKQRKPKSSSLRRSCCKMFNDLMPKNS